MPSFDIISDIHLDHLTGTGDKGLEFIDSVFENPTAPNLLIGGDVGFQSDFYSSYFFDLVKKKYERLPVFSAIMIIGDLILIPNLLGSIGPKDITLLIFIFLV